MPGSNARSLIEMNAGMHRGLANEEYYRHQPKLGKGKLSEFAQEFATTPAK